MEERGVEVRLVCRRIRYSKVRNLVLLVVAHSRQKVYRLLDDWERDRQGRMKWRNSPSTISHRLPRQRNNLSSINPSYTPSLSY